MKTDATTKLLLAALAGALWVIALRPMVQPQPAQAQAPAADTRPALATGERFIYVAEKGRIYRFSPDLGRPSHIGEYGPGITAR